MYVGVVCIVLTCACLSQAGILRTEREYCKTGETLEAYIEDCTKYVSCDGIAWDIMSCAFPLKYEQTTLNCNRDAKCENDVCAGKPDDTTRAAKGHCRGYWKCALGKSVPTCCDYGWRYNATTSKCENITSSIPNECHTCLDAHVADDTVNNTANVIEAVKECNMGVVLNDPSKYTISAQGHPDTTMSCSPGTVFNVTVCECVASATRLQKTCTPDLYLPFTSDTNDESTIQSQVKATDVVVANGVATFDGTSSGLSIQRYANVDQISVIVIEMKYTKQGSGNQILVSNGDCFTGQQASVVITDDGASVLFSVGTIDENHKNYTLHDLTVARPPNSPQATDIQLELVGGTLTGTVNGESSSLKVPGVLNNVHCPLIIGKQFAGEIDDIKIYLCKPKLVVPV